VGFCGFGAGFVTGAIIGGGAVDEAGMSGAGV
jgi:hypothetical protein